MPRLRRALPLGRTGPAWCSASRTSTSATELPTPRLANSCESGADVLVVLETTPSFRDAFDLMGGQQVYPHRVFDPDDGSAYAVSIYASRPPQQMAMVSLGELRRVRRGAV